MLIDLNPPPQYRPHHLPPLSAFVSPADPDADEPSPRGARDRGRRCRLAIPLVRIACGDPV